MAVTKRAIVSRGFIKISVEERGPIPRKMRRAHTAVMKKVWKDNATYHHTENREKRFTEAGARELNFKPRTSAYEQRKQRTHGHRRPNVWTGRSERASRSVRLTSTSSGARMRYRLPALNFHTGAAEFRRVSKEEANQIAEVHAKSFEQHQQRETE